MQRATCHVHFVWDDLGVLYWPRWVRRGFCKASGAPVDPSSASSSSWPSSSSSSSGKARGIPSSLTSASLMTSSDTPSMAESCSWPPGMHCVAAESRRIRLLRWQCQDRAKWRRAHRDAREGRRRSPGGKGANRERRKGKHSAGATDSTRVQARSDKLNGFVMPAERDLLATAVGASRSGRPNDVERRIKRESRFAIGGGGSVVVKNHTVRDVISRDRTEEAEEEETNETESWNWKQSRRKSRSMRCKWKKIPYPVTDDCFCSC